MAAIEMSHLAPRPMAPSTSQPMVHLSQLLRPTFKPGTIWYKWYTNIQLARTHSRILYRTTWPGYLWEFLQACLGIAAFVGSVVVTYRFPEDNRPTEKNQTIRLLFISATVCFIIDLAMRIFMAPSLPSYLWSFDNIMDCVVIFPPLFTRETSTVFYLLQSLRLLRSFRILHVAERHTSNTTSVAQATTHSLVWGVVYLVWSVVVIMLLFALWMPLLEPNNVATFHEGIYFAIVTMTTVGYGDYHPNTLAGKIFVMIAILVTFVSLPARLSQLIPMLFQLKNKRLGNLRHQPFVLVCGHFTPSDIYRLADEFNSPEHQAIAMRLGLGAGGLKLKFMSPTEPTLPMRECFADPFIATRVEYAVGDPANTDDLKHIKASQARAIIILCDNMYGGDHKESDARAVMYTLCLVDANPEAVVIVEVFEPSARDVVVSLGATYCHCLYEAHRFLAARCLCCPGFSTLLFNLMATTSEGEKAVMNDDNTAKWLREYADGRDREIYSIVLPDTVTNVPFQECVRLLYEQHGLVLVAVMSADNPHLVPFLGARNSNANASSTSLRCFLNPSLPGNSAGEKLLVKADSIGFVLSVRQPPQFRMFHSEDMQILDDEFAEMVKSFVSADDEADFVGSGVPDNHPMSPTSHNMHESSKNDGGGSSNAPDEAMPQTLGPPPEDIANHCVVISPLVFDHVMEHALLSCQHSETIFTGVVFLDPNEPSPEAIETMLNSNRKTPLYFVKGSGNNHEDLTRAGATTAKSVFVRCPRPKTAGEEQSWEETVVPIKTSLTLESMLVTAKFAKLKKQAAAAAGNTSTEHDGPFVCSEVFTTSQGEFQSYTITGGCLDPMHPFSLSPALVSGRVVNHELWNHAAMTQLVFKPFLSFLLPLFFMGQTVLNTNTNTRHCTSVELENVPTSFAGQPFGQLFLHVLASGRIVIGLLRQTFGAPLPYVCTCPDAGTIVDPSDKMYIIDCWEWKPTK